MSTAMIEDTAALPVAPLSVADVAFAHRWLARMQAEHSDIPEALLRAYFEGEAEPSVADLQEALSCDESHAEGWRKVLTVRLVSPGFYGESFAAADVVTACQQAVQRYQEDVRATAQRLEVLQQQIEASKAYALSLADAEEQAEVQAKVAALDEDRVAVLRHQGDLPGVGTLLEHQLTEAQAALSQAEAELKAAQVDSLQRVEDAWLQELLAALEPVRMLLAQGAWLDQAWEKLEVPSGHDHGRERLRDVALSRLRR